ncbi:MAG: zinc-binding alcohol dehydrogenase family protein [Planctomycetota bacterium]
MKAWLLDRFEGVGALRLAEMIDPPVPGLGEVLVRVRYAALNPADRFLAENLYPAQPPLPHVLGRDGCGIVESIGAGIHGLRAGQEVCILRGDAGVQRWGTFAEYVVVPSEALVPKPPAWSEPQASAAALVYLTAHQAINQWGAIPAGTVLITGISGGVGIASLQLAKAYGHRVIGTTRGDAKRDRLAELGAGLLVDPADPRLKAAVKEFTNGKGVDLIVETIGGVLFNTIIDTLGYGGRISVIGALGGNVPDFNTAKLLFRRVKIGGVLVNDYQGQPARRAWDEVLRLLDSVEARPIVDSVFPFERLPDAFGKLAEGPFGKVVLQVDPSA